jgi:hypothetical protein
MDFFSTSKILEDLNWSIRGFLDGMDGKKTEVRNTIKWYSDRIGYYYGILEKPQPENSQFLLYQDEVNTTDLKGVKFLYTFWFEAMTMYIKSEVIRCEKDRERITNEKD